MSIFANAAGNATQAASKNYVPTAELINRGCGPDFVNSTVPTVRGAAASLSRSTISSTIYLFSALILLLGHFLL